MMEPYVIHFAPLQGYTDSVYREAHAQIFGGVETYYTPFVRLEKTGFRNKELRDLVPEANTSASLVPQMIAASPEEFRRIAGLFRESGYRLILIWVVLSRCRHDNIGERVSCLIRMR